MLRKIVSGGQTGVDQGALEAGLLLNIPTGGFCPRGKICETGTIPEKYPLTETSSSDYETRTEKNIIRSHGTLILTRTFSLKGGTLLTRELAEKHRKPCLIVRIDQNPPVEAFTDWLNKYDIRVLNIAGSRESKCPGIFDQTISFLKKLFSG